MTSPEPDAAAEVRRLREEASADLARCHKAIARGKVYRACTYLMLSNVSRKAADELSRQLRTLEAERGER